MAKRRRIKHFVTLGSVADNWRCNYARLAYEIKQAGIDCEETRNGVEWFDSEKISPILCDLVNKGIAKGPPLTIRVPGDNVEVTDAGERG